ncbi:hypothetical protein [Streptomyces sp. NPDC048641]|uniref:hypothetical protein n=1 Tax=Streptomyces sp. NPDC048641 TaxID=3154825 RepID=UPI00341A94FA
MGITTAWAISSHDDPFIEGLGPRMLPLVEAERDRPGARRSWHRWHRRPLPDYRTWWNPYGQGSAEEAESLDGFWELTACGDHVQELYDGSSPDDGFWLVRDVWEETADTDVMFMSVQNKDYAVASLFHAIGPRRAALLPGWCGNFLLTSTQVQETLPRVERALTFTREEWAAAQDQDWLEYAPDEESVLEGPLRVWRRAAEAGLGLCGVAVKIY